MKKLEQLLIVQNRIRDFDVIIFFGEIIMSATKVTAKQEEIVGGNITLSKESYQRLLELKRITEADNIGQIIKNALRLYETMVNEAEANATFYIKRAGDKSPVPYEVFGKET